MRPTRQSLDGLGRALALVLAVLAARVLYAIAICPYELVEDEAQYWLWSRYLDWSYYSKGPGVAWAIALSTWMLGHDEWAVRMPTMVLSAFGALCAAGLARDIARDARRRPAPLSIARDPVFEVPSRVALCAAAAYTLAPALQGAGLLMTIDGPYLACWVLAAWAGWHALGPGRARARWSWLVLGLAIAVGFLFKYTMLLILPGLAWYACHLRKQRDASSIEAREVAPPRRVLPRWVWMLAGAVIAMLGLVPVLVWNQQHGWPTVKHLLGHVNVAGGDVAVSAGESEWSPWWSLELIGQQCGLIGPWLVLAGIGVWRAFAKLTLTDPRRDGYRFLSACSLPILMFYLLVSLKAEPEGNWPMGAYATLMPMVGWVAADALAKRRSLLARGLAMDWITRRGRRWWRYGAGYGLVAAVLIHFAMPITGAINAVMQSGGMARALSVVNMRPPKPIVLGRLTGSKLMAAELGQRWMETFPPQKWNGHPGIMTQHYGRAAQLSYYMRDQNNRPHDVWCAMSITGGRRSQFDIWEHTRLDQARGDNDVGYWLVLSNDRPEVRAVWEQLFERFEMLPQRQLAGEHKPDRFVFKGIGFKRDVAARLMGLPVTQPQGPAGGSVTP